MCDEHRTEAAPQPSVARRRARPHPCKPDEARRAVERAVSERCRATHTPCDAQALSDALLVASELTTNAILHGGGITDFHVTVEGRGVCVSVSDRSTALPVAREPVDPHGRWRPGGHGWPIVCRLARDVRVTDLPTGGKRITAVVPLS
ncbi:anti-sigma regulatory factor (Ser/Thr protein kinase) [Streptomyces sp. SAI-208]|jgi:anti-sigma regulatory factor (Ser/Thr protein kinase)|uniref:ATP-binding protein n=1 Tax=unclassified Streptomyces TaxID=2593676 RepID=UPI0024772941|nr:MULTISPECIES: ATP-binding protein [unclassified Streptomyces]MDH6521242.1 anti-sigma regulatory factor (Ser/Thr protein kinase) [Streptomyces sp. SAI-090]MDH6553464.1 anti-sigma regulatory factor (Ser/Thr protein kinase) [Streptomyces sp. SAI-041]MDH6582494.1 anti-sigma regulatory factor (Ser/Thr protein kinase) [Streptomyces sp. SAI-133]MDH6612241.1 anti-sigma regulatory factor (Ser/Thr protein kinase) [Streptomyces sp. SAI-208]MDH6614663.1 anti-sigma regulatory factor (Ser/Thr protein kin